jgi:hypothetical protein
MKRTKPFLILALWLLAAPALAGGLSKQEALNEFSGELAQCAAFYSVGIHCFSSGGQLQGEDKANFEFARFFFYQLQYSIGKAAGLSDKALDARFALALESINDDMDKKCINISVMLKKYAKLCKALGDHPDQQLDRLMKEGPPKLE